MVNKNNGFRFLAGYGTKRKHGSLRRRILWWLIGPTLLAPGMAMSQEPLFVHSLQANLLAEPRADAPPVARLVRGTQVELLESKASWRKVRHDTKQGWIFAYFLTAHPPGAPAPSVETGEIDREHVRRRASAVVTAGATRGLTSQDRARAHAEGLANYRALHAMEEISISEAQLHRFIESGIPE